MEAPSYSFTFKMVDDLPINLDVYTPTNTKEGSPCPVVVFFHGGGLVAFSRQFLPPWLLQASLARGWIFVSADYRLLPQVNGLDILSDISAAWDYVHNNLTLPGFQIDKQKIMVAGASAGGYCAYLVAAHCRPRPAALLSVYGITTFDDDFFKGGRPPRKYPIRRADVQTFLDDTRVSTGATPFPSTEQQEWILQLGDAAPVPDPNLPIDPSFIDRWSLYEYFIEERAFEKVLGSDKMLNPLEYIDATYPSSVIIHGTADTAVPTEQSIKLQQKLQSKGVKVWLRLVPGAEHGFEAFAKNFDSEKSQLWSTQLAPLFDHLDTALNLVNKLF